MSDFPYPGLRPFQRHETDIFFGRDEHTDQLIEKLGHTHFIAVIGPSGCGKSSLVRTGLLAGLETGFLANAGTHWRIAEFRPGNRPFFHLAEALLAEKALGRAYTDPFTEHDEALGFLQADLRRGPFSLNEILQYTPLPEKSHLLLLVDQFEEIFRYYQQGATDEAAAFVTLLLASCQNTSLPDFSSHKRENNIYVVITMRSDFIGDCAKFYDLPESINRGLFLTPRLTREQLRETIEEPANVFNGSIEPILVNRLLNDMGDDQNQLPSLQHAMMRMWTLASQQILPNSHQNNGENQESILTLSHYQQIGGLENALSKHANEAYEELNASQKKIAKILFCNLTERNIDCKDIRRPVELKEVATQASVPWQKVAQVVEVFRQPGRSFLTPAYGIPLAPETVLDISHESLIRQWQRLYNWVQKEAKSAQFYRRLEDTALRWHDQIAELWSGIELTMALAWRARTQLTQAWAKRYGVNQGQHFELAMRFLTECEKKQEEEEKLAELRRLHKLEQERQQLVSEQKAILAHKMAVRASVGLIVAISLALWGFWERYNALIAEEQALSSQQHAEQLETERTLNLFEAQMTHAALLARDEDYASARQLLKKTRQLDPKMPASYRHSRNLLAWFTKVMGGTPLDIYKGAGAQLLSVALSPNGRLLAAAGEKGTLILLDVHTGQIIRRLKGHTNKIYSLVFHPKGQWLASAGIDKRIIIWSLPKGLKKMEWTAPAIVKALAVTPDGTILASGGEDKNITLWATKTGRQIKTFKGHKKNISANGLAFDPSGKILGSASLDKTARLWSMESGDCLHILVGHTGSLQNIKFSPNGQQVTTGGSDKSIRLWDVATGQPQRVLLGHDNKVFAISYVNRYLVTGSHDRTLRIWDIDTGITIQVLQGHTSGVTDITTDQTAQIFSVSNDGTIMRWGLPHQFMVDLPNEPASVAISPTGYHVAVGFANGTLRWYSLSDNPHLLWEQQKAHADNIQRLAFNSKGNLLASAGFDNSTKLWQIKGDNLKEIQTLKGHKEAISAVTFTPNGENVITSSYDDHIGIYNLVNQNNFFFQAALGEDVNSISIDASGSKLLSANDYSMRLWHFSCKTPPIQLQTFPKMQELILWGALSMDGKLAASVGRNWSVHIYSTDTAQLRHRLVGHEQTTHRAIFSPDSHQLATASGDATVRIWDLNHYEELFTLRLPSRVKDGAPLWDFDFRCTPRGCWIAVPLTRGKLVLYDMGQIYGVNDTN